MTSQELPFSQELITSAAGDSDQLFNGVIAVSNLLNPQTNVDWIENEITRFVNEVQSDVITLDAMLDVLITYGFNKTTFDYADPYRYSELDAVLRSGEGLPILIGMIVMEVSRRLGFSNHGINFPGVFLVSVQEKVLSLQGLELIDYEKTSQKLKEEFNVVAPPKEAAASNRQILVRILNNVCENAMELQDTLRAFEIADYIKTITTESTYSNLLKAKIWLSIEDLESAIKEIEIAKEATENDLDRRFLEDQIRSILKRKDSKPELLN